MSPVRDSFAGILRVGWLTVGLAPLCAVFSLSAGEKPSSFDRIEERLSSSPQVSISFRHIVVSEFFETADTVDGRVTFTNDGRYRTELGADEYLFDGSCLWEYSRAYAQATRNCLRPGQRIDDSFLFFRNFDRYYSITEAVADSLYRLYIIPARRGSAPDSLVIAVDKGREWRLPGHL
ncbi:MAG: outer membrane lipoprotein carrier protein LolA [Candidatus Zixiibacteriota bacterium]